MRRDRQSPPQSKSSSSSSSSSSSEFEFNISISPRKASSSLCPADELFYKGQLLPLQLSPRLSLVRTLCSSSSSSSSSSSARDSTESSSTAARDSTESSSSSTDSTASFPLLLHTPQPLDSYDSSSRPSSVTDDEDFFKPIINKKNQSNSKSIAFSLSRFSSVFKKDTKTVRNHSGPILKSNKGRLLDHSSSNVPAAAPSSVKRMSSTAKEVIRKYMKKVKPLYEKLSQKQHNNSLKVSSAVATTGIRGITVANTTTNVTTSAISGGGTSISFSGNFMRYTKRGRCAASCPSSMRSSPSHSGVLTRGGFPVASAPESSSRGANNSKSVSSMEELQSAIQGAIMHCKNSMLQKNNVLVSSLEI